MNPTEATSADSVAEIVRVVAIDGPAGSGKSTVAKLVAERVKLPYLDTGAMYRAVAHAWLERPTPEHGQEETDAIDDAELATLGRAIDLEMPIDGRVIVNGRDATTAIRSAEVTRLVSRVAANPDVREEMRERQRRFAREAGGGVLEGRDIGTVVFPDALLKVYLTASIAERARRRAEQSGLDPAIVEADMRARDEADSQREHAPLAVADDAVEVDTTEMTIGEVIETIAELLAERVRQST